MEANEAQELKEQAEKGGESALRPVAFTMSVLAVLVAITTVLGHRTHTEAVLYQGKASDQWNEYQAHRIRAHETDLALDLQSYSPIADKAKAAELSKKYAGELAKREETSKDDKEKAEAFDKRVEQAELRANRFDLGEALLEIGLVITSVTLLTRSRIYWYFGILFSLAGVVSAASAYFLH